MKSNSREAEDLKAKLLEAERRISDLEAKMCTDSEGKNHVHSGVNQNGMLMAIADAVWVKDAEGVYIFCNEVFESIIGLPKDYLIGKNGEDCLLGEWIESDFARDREVFKSGNSIVFDDDLKCRTGVNAGVFEVIKSPLSDEHRNTIGVLSIARDISKHKMTEDALSLEIKRRKMLMDISYDGIAIFNDEHLIVDFNKRFTEMLGYSPEEILKLHSWDFDTDYSEQFIRENFQMFEESTNIIETHHRRKNGTVYPVEVSANGAFFDDAYFMITISRDISDRVEKARMLRKMNHMKKMEAIGQMAAGIAHDFNNVISGIMGAAQLLLRYLPDDPKAHRRYQLIVDAAHRASSLTSSLLTFSREAPKASVPVDLHAIIEDVLHLSRMTINENVVVELALDAELSTITGDPSLLQNMLLNLCVNSSHAMHDGGVLSISTSQRVLDAMCCKSSMFDIKPGAYLEIEVRDTGCGIPHEHLSKIFEPFFTTKEHGKGTGLGLSSVFGTVQQHGGAISVYSEIGLGTVFQMLLPLGQEVATSDVGQAVPMRGSGTILVVDDDEAMRLSASGILEGLGYTVLLANNGEDALYMRNRQSESIDLVLLDIAMPVMNGKECFRRMMDDDPETCIVFSSGFIREEDVTEFKEKGLKGVIRKPFRGDELGHVIGAVLNGEVK